MAKHIVDHDKYILDCARELIRAINASNRTVLRPEVDAGYGHVDISIYNKNEIAVWHASANGYRITGPITDVK